MKHLLLFPIAATLLFVSCRKDEEKPEYRDAPVSRVTGSKSGRTQEPMSFQVYFTVSNSCGRFHNFLERETGSGYSRDIVVNARYEPGGCFEAPMELSATYTFIPPEPGTYYLRFSAGERGYVTDTVTVQ